MKQPPNLRRFVLAAFVLLSCTSVASGCGSRLVSDGIPTASSTRRTRPPPRCGSRLVSDGIPTAGSVPGVEVTVYRAVDGDTALVEPGIDGQGSVRLIGVDAPETGESQPLATEAAGFAEEGLEGRRIRLEFDRERRDDYGRVLAYAYLPDGSMFNETLLREGLAQVATFPPNTRHVGRFEEAQDEARDAKRGIWSLPRNEGCRLRDRGNGIGGDC